MGRKFRLDEGTYFLVELIVVGPIFIQSYIYLNFFNIQIGMIPFNGPTILKKSFQSHNFERHLHMDNTAHEECGQFKSFQRCFNIQFMSHALVGTTKVETDATTHSSTC